MTMTKSDIEELERLVDSSITSLSTSTEDDYYIDLFQPVFDWIERAKKLAVPNDDEREMGDPTWGSLPPRAKQNPWDITVY